MSIIDGKNIFFYGKHLLVMPSSSRPAHSLLRGESTLHQGQALLCIIGAIPDACLQVLDPCLGQQSFQPRIPADVSELFSPLQHFFSPGSSVSLLLKVQGSELDAKDPVM